MRIIKKTRTSRAVRFSWLEGDVEVGRAWLYLIKNDLHSQPYGLLEDVYLDKEKRGQGWGLRLVKRVIKEAERLGCYKLIATCRYQKPGLLAFYQGLGFEDHGKEFRLNLK